MINPTPEQKRVLDAVRKLTVGGISPSFEELRQECGLASRSSVHRLVHGLRDRGLIEFIDGRSRSIRIIDELEGLDQRSTAELRTLRDRLTQIIEDRGSAR